MSHYAFIKKSLDGARVLLIPGTTDDKNLDLAFDNHNVLTWTVYRLIGFVDGVDNKVFRAKSATLNPAHKYNAVVARYSGDDLLDENTAIGKIYKTTQVPIFEYYWCPLNGRFLLERMSFFAKPDDTERKVVRGSAML